MPLFEYSCRACGKQFTFLVGVIKDNDEAQCPRCQSHDLQKLMSRFARGRSDDEKMEAVAEKMEERNMDDPASLRQFAREIGRELSMESGVDMRDEMEAMIEADARGESFDDFENDDLDGDDGESHQTNISSNADDGTIY